MSTTGRRRLAHLTAIAVVLAGLGACNNDKIVYRETERFSPPAENAAGFYGYADTSSQLTACGTCHSSQQAAWKQTKHASAWADLVAAMPTGNEECAACHTVSNKGNGLADEQVGYVSTKDARYQDVQCESCHGRGETHLPFPTNTNMPMASANVDPTLASTNGCGACHNDSHHPYVEEWAAGPHGAMPGTMSEASHIMESTTCQSCHSGEGVLARFGVNTAFKEKGHTPTGADFLKITCTVCHDPHSNRYDGQLRFDAFTTDTAANLCMKCHNRNQVPSVTSYRGPHSAEGQLFFGLNAGWKPAGFTTTPIVGTHADKTVNPKLCVNCHMPTMTVNKPSGEFLANATGHLFLATPCLDADGRPTAGTCTISQRSFKACTGSGCHGSEEVARSVLTSSENRLNYRLEELKTLLENTARIPCSEFATVAAGQPLTIARGARFNYLLAVGHAEGEADVCGATDRALPEPIADAGAAAHNPFYLEQLLSASIAAVKARYYTTTP